MLLVKAIATRWGSHPDTRMGWSRKAVWFELSVPTCPGGTAPGQDHDDVKAPLPVRPPGSMPGRQVPLETDLAILRRVLHALRHQA